MTYSSIPLGMRWGGVEPLLLSSCIEYSLAEWVSIWSCPEEVAMLKTPLTSFSYKKRERKDSFMYNVNE